MESRTAEQGPRTAAARGWRGASTRELCHSDDRQQAPLLCRLLWSCWKTGDQLSGQSNGRPGCGVLWALAVSAGRRVADWIADTSGDQVVRHSGELAGRVVNWLVDSTQVFLTIGSKKVEYWDAVVATRQALLASRPPSVPSFSFTQPSPPPQPLSPPPTCRTNAALTPPREDACV